MAAAKKTSIILIVFGIKEKQLLREKYFYPVFIIIREMTTSLSSLTHIFYSSFLWTFNLSYNISLHLNSQLIYSVGERLCYCMNLIICMCFGPLIRVWFLTCWASLTNITLVNVLSVTRVSSLQG